MSGYEVVCNDGQVFAVRPPEGLSDEQRQQIKSDVDAFMARAVEQVKGCPAWCAEHQAFDENGAFFHRYVAEVDGVRVELSATEDPVEGREAPLVGLPTMSSDFVPVAEAAALRDALVAALSAMGADR